MPGAPPDLSLIHILIGIDKDGGVCERIYVDENVLYKVPDGISDKAATVIEPLAVIVRAIHQSGFKTMDTCVVIGAGPIGMLTGIVLKFAGASKVFISDVAAKRLDQARAVSYTHLSLCALYSTGRWV